MSADAVPVTLVIPTYNRANLVRETVDAALKQTRPFADVIVVDDGSKDNTLEILASYGSRIVLIPIANQGVQVARNVGIDAAQTPFVALCDSDDLLEPEYAQTMYEWMFHDDTIDVGYANFRIFDENGLHGDKLSASPFDFLQGSEQRSPRFHTRIPDLYRRNLRYQPLFPTGQMVRKEFLKRMGNYNKAFRGVGAEDWEFTLRAILSGAVGVCARPLCRVRKHDGNISNDPMRSKIGEVKILRHSLSNHPGAEHLRKKFGMQWMSACGKFSTWHLHAAILTLRRPLKGNSIPCPRERAIS